MPLLTWAAEYHFYRVLVPFGRVPVVLRLPLPATLAFSREGRRIPVIANVRRIFAALCFCLSPA